jgi:hypothetical protein
MNWGLDMRFWGGKEQKKIEVTFQASTVAPYRYPQAEIVRWHGRIAKTT